MSDWQIATLSMFITGFALGLVYWPVRQHKMAWLSVPIALCMAGLGYWYWGSWQVQTAYTQRMARLQAAESILHTIKSPSVLIEKLEQHLYQHPRSVRGWYLLGRLYASQRMWDKSHAAFARAYALDTKDVSIAVNYAQSLLFRKRSNNQELARKILLKTLQQDPQQKDALMMLAIDAQQRHANQEALTYWRRLLVLVPDSSADADTIRKAIRQINSQ